MKIVYSHDVPFFLAHGGSQTYIENVMREMAVLGETVEPERWWDECQTGDILHYIGRAPIANVHLAHEKGFKVVMTELMDMTASRTPLQLKIQRILIRQVRRLMPSLVTRLSWESFRAVDALIFCSPIEAAVAHDLFNADTSRSHYVGLGIDAAMIRALAEPAPEGDYLVSVATIAPRKNTILLAEAARHARIPVRFLGKPYAEDDAYFRQFTALVDGQSVRYDGFVSPEEKCQILRRARGFALLSRFETGCIAVHEASAAGLPLFLSDLPWAARGYPGAQHLKLCPLGSPSAIAGRLSEFYAGAHRARGQNFPVQSWGEVAEQIRAVYTSILKGKVA